MLCTFGPDCIGILCFTRGNEGRAEDAVFRQKKDTWCVEMAQQQKSGLTGTNTHTQEVLTENRVSHRLCTQKGTQVSKIFVTAKPGVYPKGDTFRGILELQLEAGVLALIVFGELKKGNGSAGAVFISEKAQLF